MKKQAKPPEAPAGMFELPGTETEPQTTPAAEREEIHANHCVVGSECNMTDGCRGKLRATRATTIKGHNGPQVQIFCPVCGKFAAGHRPLAGLTRGVGKEERQKLFDRTKGKAV